VWLRDVWLPKEGKMLTMGNMTKTLLRVVDWEGPATGPYKKLGYSDVPGNLMPLSPVSLWRDLHELSNKLLRKLGNQAESQKTVLGFSGGDDESVANFKGASDGEGIRYTGADPRPLTAGGVDPRTMAFYLQCRDMFSYFAGNIDSLGGLGKQTGTVGQDKMLGAAAGSQMRDMVDRTVDVIREIFRDLAFYEWNDPLSERMLEKPIPGTDMSIPVKWGKDSKKGKFDMYDLDIDVYSLQDNSPDVRLQKLDMIMKNYIIPLAPQIKEDGGSVDVQAIFKMVGKYANFPELEDVVKFSEPQSSGQQQQPQQGQRVPQGTAPPSGGDGGGGGGMSRQGADATLSQQLLSQGPAGGPIPGSENPS
jgi:hypothetical protein